MAPLARGAAPGEFPQSAVLVPESPTPAGGGTARRMWYSIEDLTRT
jgi:hypothetical protein